MSAGPAAASLVGSSRAASTIKNYRGFLNRFGVWLKGQGEAAEEEHRRLESLQEDGGEVEEGELEALAQRKLYARGAREEFQEGRTRHTIVPSVLYDLKIEPFFEYLTSLQDRTDSNGNPNPVSAKTMKVYRSAMKWAFEEAGLAREWAEWEAVTARAFRGLGSRDSSLREAGYGHLTEGKEELPFVLYELLLRTCMSSERSQLRWAGPFLALQWNTASRSKNTSKLHLSHLSVQNDSLLAYFSRSKTDQTGSLPQHKSHIFANPFSPSLCPLLHLGLLLMEFDVGDDDFLFPGSAQQTRYGDVLNHLFSQPGPVRDLMESLGLRPSDLGTHSVLKGASSYACSGTPQGVGIIAMCIRAAWKIGSVLQRYLKHQDAGDCVAGRTLAGLPTNSQEFAILPPHFDPLDPEADHWLRACFRPTLLARRSLVPVLRLCFAQMVFHYDFLRDTLHDRHMLFTTQLFGDSNKVADLKQRLIFDYTSPHMKATGIPVWVNLLQDMEKLSDRVEKLTEGTQELSVSLKEDLVPRLVEGVEHLLETRDVDRGSLTIESVRRVVNEALGDFSEQLQRTCGDAGASSGTPPGPTATAAVTHAAEQQSGGLARHGQFLDTEDGRIWLREDTNFTAVPPDFSYPSTMIDNGWLLWNIGDTGMRIRPFRRFMATRDFLGSRRLIKSASEWRKLFSAVEAYLRHKNEYIEGASSEAEVRHMYLAAKPFIKHLIARSGTQTTERPLTVLTVARKMRRMTEDEIHQIAMDLSPSEEASSSMDLSVPEEEAS